MIHADFPPTSHLHSLPARIRYQQAKRGLTNRVLAELVGRTERWVEQLRAGLVDPKLSDACNLAEALRTDIRWLLGEEDDVNRRRALQVIGTAAAGLALDPAALLIPPPVVSAGRLIEDQAEVLRNLSAMYWRVSLGETQRLLTEHQAHLLGLLRTAPPAAQGPLQSLAAEAGLQAGLAAHDRDDEGSARQHFAFAERLASSAGNGSLLAALLTARRVTVSQTDARGGGDRAQGQQAIALLDAAEQAAGRRSPREVRAWIYCSRAEEYAALGQEAAAFRDLDRAGRVLAASGDLDRPIGLNAWDEVRLASWRASVLLYLHQPQDAVDLLTALPRSSAAPDHHVYQLANLASAYAMAGAGQDAVRLGGEVLTLAAGIGLQEGPGRVRRVQQDLLRAGDRRSAGMLAERLEAV